MKIAILSAFPIVLSSQMAISAETSGASHKKICIAGVATIMGKSPSIMNSKEGNEVITVSYKRPDDGTLWSYKCKVAGNKIIWGNLDGRWRTHPDDGVVTFIVAGNKIVVREEYPDGSATRKEFSLNKLGK